MELLDISLQARVIIGISAMVLLFTGFLIVFISNQQKKLLYHKNLQAMHEQQQQSLLEQNALLEQRVKERTNELLEQKDALQQALSELKASQLQLVQKEKMASLGELTAGVAHEIQNPLNFVLNFSDINVDLLGELKSNIEQVEVADATKEEMLQLANDLAGNMTKILQHGRRADGIVKSMLQHSRVQAGNTELVDINELVEEYCKMGYHGYRNKHKSFSCELQTFYSNDAGKLYAVPQDLGHILLNLFNNAFYSMAEKLKVATDGYKPVLNIRTSKEADKVMVEVRDNGMGISEKIIHKIYQPFFTTKPTGEATGLGLSLSYDMIKAHQGELKVASVEGEYASFRIELSV